MRTSARPSGTAAAILALAMATALGTVEGVAQQGVTRYVRFTDNSGTHSGILEAQRIRVLDRDPVFEDASPTGRTVALGDVTLEIPMDPNRVPKIFGVAGNWNNPAGNPVQVEHPSWFVKYNTSLNRNGDPVEVPFGATNFNFEGELVLIIGRDGRFIPESEALDHLFGVAVGNDYSENDWCGEGRGSEEPTHVFCKAGDSFAVLGDQVVTGLDLSDLELTVRLNSQLAAQGSTRDFRDPPAALISKLSRYVTLQRGDLIYTGTVAPPQLPGTRRQLWQDDVVEVAIEQIGSLSNKLVRVTRRPMYGPPIPEARGVTSYVRVQHDEGWSFGILNGSRVHELSGDPVATFGLNLRHSSLELNWHVPVMDEEALELKNYLVRALDKEDISTHGLTFSVTRAERMISFTSVAIEILDKDPKGPPRYNVRYAQDFDPNRAEYHLFVGPVGRESLPQALLELSRRYSRQIDTDLREDSRVLATAEPVGADPTHRCGECLTVYDRAYGEPCAGVEAGTPFEALPDDYVCYVCSAEKNKFVPVSAS